MHKFRVGVLMGGRSIEHEISFNSGRTVCDHLDTSRYDIVPLFHTVQGTLFILPWHFLHRGKTTDFHHRLAHEAEEISWDRLKEKVDFVYIALHGRYGEDGTLQGLLEVLRIPYLGSRIFGSALGMNKAAQKTFLKMHSISVAASITVDKHLIESIEIVKEMMKKASLALPVVIKPVSEGSSLGVSVVEQWEDLPPALQKACSINPIISQSVIIEQKIDGMEFSCTLITDKNTGNWCALPPTEVVVDNQVQFFDYKQKYMPGQAIEFTPARCPAETIKTIQETCIATAQALEFRTLARIDGILQKDGSVIIIDPNSLSGMAPASFLFKEAALLNMTHTHVINHLIETELHHYNITTNLLDKNKDNMIAEKKEKIRVAVLFGGATNEREISLESGRNVLYKLMPQLYEGIPLFVDAQMNLFRINQEILVRGSTQEISQLLMPAMQIGWSSLASVADFVFIALHGGLGENGGVQGMLEMLNISYNGSSVFASALCMNKYRANQFLRSHGFHVPSAVLITRNEWHLEREKVIAHIVENITPAWIVKPNDDGCSVLVQKVYSCEELINACERIWSTEKNEILIEECINGMELTIGVVGNEQPYALVPSAIVTNHDILSIEEKFLPGAGENQTPAPLTPAVIQYIQETAVKAYQTIGCKGYARIDCFYRTESASKQNSHELVFIEFNTLPGLTPATCIFHQAAEANLKPMEFIHTIIKLGMEKHRMHHIQPDSSIHKHIG